MEPEKQPAPEYYVWEVPGKPVVVHLYYEAVEGLLNEVMRGFGAVPKRGAEVGGILIGTIEPGEISIVRVEDFEPVECEYRRGPSYLLSEFDGAAFRETCLNWQPNEERPAYAVGFFRGHTRDGMSLAAEDIKLLDECFPSPEHIALLIKPYGTRVSMAGFFFRENGVFQEKTPLEFPFRTAELRGEAPPQHKSLIESRVESRAASRALAAASRETVEPIRQQPAPAYAIATPSQSRMRSAMWIPLSFVFLLFGVALGLMIALGRTAAPAHDDTDFSLGLSIVPVDGNLSVKWNREAPAIHTADRGVLEIEDGTFKKSVDMDAPQLSNGSILYRNSSKKVHFRLVVYPKAHLSVAETLDWSQ